jgi:anti-sigma regulatory factor (Ser/Thr protein kinase)
VESITLPPGARSVAMARQWVRNLVSERDLDTSVAELLTTELVSNVVRHANTDVAVMAGFDGCVRVEVHDGQAATNAFREILNSAPMDVPLDSPGRRGIPLVRYLASRFGLADEPGVWSGKIVWFELDWTDLQLDELGVARQ